MIKLFIRIYIRLIILANRLNRKFKKQADLAVGEIVIIYRISDAGYAKVKPEYINNENCLKNAVSVFPVNKCKWHVIADNCCEETLSMIYNYVPKASVQIESVGHGAGTFNLGYSIALNYEDDDIIYFLENDYIHTADGMKVLQEGFSVDADCEYVCLYDHPDKYDSSHRIKSLDEKTVVYLSESRHWKITSSTTMTLAAKVKTLKRDEKIFRRWTTGRHPYDFRLFMNLRLKNRKLISPIPSASTHGESDHLAARTDWKSVYESQV